MDFMEQFRELKQRAAAHEEERKASGGANYEYKKRLLRMSSLIGSMVGCSTAGNLVGMKSFNVRLISALLATCVEKEISVSEFLFEYCNTPRNVNELPKLVSDRLNAHLVYDRIAELVVCQGQLCEADVNDPTSELMSIRNTIQVMLLAALAIHHHVTPQWLSAELERIWSK